MTPADVQVTFCATLVDQWLALGLQHAVVAPGSRSTPMAMALAARPELELHVAHDERTAALGGMHVTDTFNGSRAPDLKLLHAVKLDLLPVLILPLRAG